jgi:hypothetical protein
MKQSSMVYVSRPRYANWLMAFIARRPGRTSLCLDGSPIGSFALILSVSLQYCPSLRIAANRLTLLWWKDASMVEDLVP